MSAQYVSGSIVLEGTVTQRVFTNMNLVCVFSGGFYCFFWAEVRDKLSFSSFICL